MPRIKLSDQVHRIDGKDCFLEILCGFASIDKVGVKFVTYDKNKPKGARETDSITITVRRFLDDTVREVDTQISNDGGILTGHGGGDFGVMDTFVRAVAENDPSKIVTGIDETLESHLMVFAAEESRKKGIVCTLK